MGGADGREDRPLDRVRPGARGPGVLAGGLGRGAPHRPGGALPRATGRRSHLLQPEPPFGPGAADLLPVRAVGRGRCLHPGILRRGVHGGGQRLHVPRVTPDGGDGGRASGPRWRRWAGRGCTPPSPEVATTSRSTTPTPSRRRTPTSRTCLRAGAARCRRTRPRSRLRRSPPASSPPTSGVAFDMHERPRRAGRRRQLLRGETVVRARGDRRVRAARRATDRDRGEQLGAQGGRALRRLVGQGRPLHLGLRRLRRSRWCSWPTCPASWSGPRSSARGSSGTAPR